MYDEWIGRMRCVPMYANRNCSWSGTGKSYGRDDIFQDVIWFTPRMALRRDWFAFVDVM
jgi:hypothetical protein